MQCMYVYTMYLINETICIYIHRHCKLIALALTAPICVDLIVFAANFLCYFQSTLNKLFLSYLILSKQML